MGESVHADVDKFVRGAKQWKNEIMELRSILQSTLLEEDFKWSKPTYTHEGSNIAIIQPFKGCVALMFFKGMLMKDAKGLLQEVGPNSQAAKRIEFTSLEEISKAKTAIKSYVKEAIALEAAGEKVEFKKKVDEIPEELLAMFRKKPAFKKAFEALTPGRQRAYILNISQAKQSATRVARVEKHLPRIMEGKGIND